MKIWTLALLLMTGSAQAAEDSQLRMFFNCYGEAGGMAVSVFTKAYSGGELSAVTIERKGLFDEYHEQFITSTTVLGKKPYRPNNEKYKGLEKYVLDTQEERSSVQPVYDWKTGAKKDSFDFSEYVLLLPPRSELEKIWRGPGEREPNGEFKAYLQMTYSNGDNFTSGELDCALNWKP